MQEYAVVKVKRTRFFEIITIIRRTHAQRRKKDFDCKERRWNERERAVALSE